MTDTDGDSVALVAGSNDEVGGLFSDFTKHPLDKYDKLTQQCIKQKCRCGGKLLVNDDMYDPNVRLVLKCSKCGNGYTFSRRAHQLSPCEQGSAAHAAHKERRRLELEAWTKAHNASQWGEGELNLEGQEKELMPTFTPATQIKAIPSRRCVECESSITEEQARCTFAKYDCILCGVCVDKMNNPQDYLL
jgi:hypothetical protein